MKTGFYWARAKRNLGMLNDGELTVIEVVPSCIKGEFRVCVIGGESSEDLNDFELIEEAARYKIQLLKKKEKII